MTEQMFELARRTFDAPEFRGITCIEVEARSVINKVPGGGMPFDWTINPYRGCMHACVYCFARPTHTYLDMDAGRDFETKIVVKVNAPEVLGRELASRRWKGEHIAMGTGTDPYQRVEGRYRLMRGILSALITRRNPFSILTKGTLILRDVDLLTEAASVAPLSAAFSIGSMDEDVWRTTEPGAPSPRARMDAVRTLNEAGIPTGVLIAPILPGISDGPGQWSGWSKPRPRPGRRMHPRSSCTSGRVCAKSSCPGSKPTVRTSSGATGRSIEAHMRPRRSAAACRDGWTERWPGSATRSRPAVSVR